MSQVHSVKGQAILDSIRELVLENESLQNANQDLVAHNVELSTLVAELNIRLANLQASTKKETCGLVPLVEAADAPTQQPAPSIISVTVVHKDTIQHQPSSNYVPFLIGSKTRVKEVLRVEKASIESIINKKTTVVVRLSNKFVWKEFPLRASWLKPTKEFVRKGQATITPFQYHNLKKNLEFIACINNQWCYMGSYKAKSWNTLHPDDFELLSDIDKKDIYKSTGNCGKATHSDVPSMYASGELLVAEFDIHRVGFDYNLCKFLQSAAERRGRPVPSHLRIAEAGQEDSDTSDNDD